MILGVNWVISALRVDDGLNGKICLNKMIISYDDIIV